MSDALAVWLDGFPVPAGTLHRLNDNSTAFRYEGDYFAAGGLPLSLSLPLEGEEFDDVETRGFFANLLPENAQLQQTLERHGVDRGDIVGQLRLLGADCAGAISCLPIDDPPVKTPGNLATDYDVLDGKEIIKIVSSLADIRRLPAEVQDPSPVAGVQSKIALTRLPGGAFALPKPGLRVPTTHILKVPPKRNGREVRLEEAAALLAAAVGLDVAVPQALKVGSYEALLIERFDRRVEDGIVTRIHQEDFAQALGFSSELKYQRHGKPGRQFDVTAALSILDRTDDPYEARLAFMAATLFNLCIGNTDNHAKNHALLYDRGAEPRFAPLYDLVPIRLDDNFTHELAFHLGGVSHLDDMMPENIAAFLIECGVEDVTEYVEAVVVPLIEGLEEATPKLRSQGLRDFDDLIGRETDHLVSILSAAVKLRARDAFIDGAAGGWAVS